MPNDELRKALEVLLRAATAESGPPLRESHTVRQLWLRYWRAEGHTLDSAKSEDSRMRVLLNLPVPAERGLVKYGDLDIQEVTVELTMALFDRYAKTETKYGRPPKPATKNRGRARIRRMFQWEVERPRAVRMLDENPVRGLPMDKEDNVKRGKFNEPMLEILKPHSTPLAWAFTLACYDTGMREMEVVNLQWPHIDEQTGRVSLLALDRKNDDPLAPRLSARALDALQAIRVAGMPWVFGNPKTRRRYNPRWITALFDDAVSKAGLTGPNNEKLTPHSLRHSFAYIMRVVHKTPETVVQKMLGQKTRAAFVRYGIVDQAEMDAAYDVRDAGIAKATAELEAKRRGPQAALHIVRNQEETGE